MSFKSYFISRSSKVRDIFFFSFSCRLISRAACISPLDLLFLVVAFKPLESFLLRMFCSSAWKFIRLFSSLYKLVSLDFSFFCWTDINSFLLLLGVSKAYRGESRLPDWQTLMPEMPHAGKHHCDTPCISGGNHLIIAHRAAGLDNGCRARLNGSDKPVSKREKRV